MVIYKGPGKYIAICNKTNWDGHYIKRFEVPDKLPEYLEEDSSNFDIKKIAASWYFLNVLDFTACVEAVYPESLFDNK